MHFIFLFKIFPQYILLQNVEQEFRYSCSIFRREEMFQSQFNHIFFHNIIVFVVLNKNCAILVQYFEKEEIYEWTAISHFTYFTLGFDQPIHHQQRLILLHFTYMVIFKFWGSMWRVKTNSKFNNSFFPVLIYWSDNRIHLGLSNVLWYFVILSCEVIQPNLVQKVWNS